MTTPEQVPFTPAERACTDRIRAALERHKARENARDRQRQQPDRRRPA